MSAEGPIVRMVEFFDQIVQGGEKRRYNSAVMVTYVVFALVTGVVAHGFSDRDYSAVLTAGAGAQLFGFYLLLNKANTTRSASGISQKTLEMFVLAFMFRLPCTMLRNGYLPVDQSGDWVYQVADFSSMLICIQLIYCMQKKFSDTYQREFDSMPVWNIIPACVMGGVLLHGDLNHSTFFDILWAISLNIETVAMMPQLWMLTKKGGSVSSLTSNYVAALFAAACFKMAFWFYGHVEIGDEQNPTMYETCARYWCAGFHALQVLLSADFMVRYFTTCAPSAPKASGVPMPDVWSDMAATGGVTI